jgi:hypothetical protein
MPSPQELLDRLDAIGQSLAQTDHALALIGLGSAGLERERLDAWSDLDFFAVVAEGRKAEYMDNLDWLSRVAPIAFRFANTVDGFKLLFADGIFCEFAVFEPRELSGIPFAPGRIVWKRPGVEEALSRPAHPRARPAARSREWLLGEALTNLYVGLGREQRGERLTALRYIQGYAVDRALELIEQDDPSPSSSPDPFALERRFERRHPDAAARLGEWLQGYERNAASALALLAWLESRYDINRAMAEAIRRLPR